MMRKLSTREQVMIGVLAVAAVIAYRALSGDGIGLGGRSAEEESEARVFGEPPLVRMDLLAQASVDFDRSGRNLFDYYTPPPPKREPRARPKPPPPKPKPRATPPPPPPRSAPPAPRPPSPEFDYLGYLGPKDAKIAFFEHADDGIIPAGIGDAIREEFRLLEFKHDSVMLAYTDDRWQGQSTELKMKGLR